MALVSGTRYSMLVHPDIRENISVNLKDVTMNEALEAIRELYGQVNYLAGRRVGSADMRVSSGSIQPATGAAGTPATTAASTSAPAASATGQRSDSSRITTTSDNDFWTDIGNAIRTIIGADGGANVVVNAQAGVVLVRALPANLRAVEQYLKAMSLVVERQVLYWFDPVGGIGPFLPDRFPVFIWGTDGGATPYGFPAIDGPQGGVKIAFYRAPAEEVCTPETIDRRIRESEIAQMREAIAERIPALNGRFLAGATCMYTNTPDKNFIITPHPRHPQVSIACGFSGHGFKFCSVVGEILADLADRGETRHDIGLFSLDRLKR